MGESESEGKQSDFVAARILITPALEVRVLTQTFKGGLFLHLREFALTGANVFVATPKGVAVRAEQLGDVLDAVRDLREAGDREGVVARIPLSGGRAVCFAITKWQGVTKADVRLHFANGDSNELRPTKKGFRLNLALLPELERGLEALERELNG